MQNTMKSIVISLIILASFSQMRSVAQNIDIPCEVTLFSENILQEESGDLLTISGNNEDGFTIHSTSENFVEITYERNFVQLSPQGDWLLFQQSDYENDVRHFSLFSLQDSMTYEMTLPGYYGGVVSWFGAPKILITRITALPSFLPIAIVDIQTQSLVHVFSPEWRQLENELLGADTVPLIPETYPLDSTSFQISPDGRFLFWYEGYPRDEHIVYDATIHQEFLGISDYIIIDSLWSQDSRNLVFRNGMDDQYYIFDIASNTFERVSDFAFEDDILLDIENGSWSPDNHYLAFRVIPGLSQLSMLQILDTTNGATYSSCFTNTDLFREFGFAWSHDSRFLAFEGVLNEREGIYIYDVMENQVYEFEHEDRQVLGWSNPSN